MFFNAFKKEELIVEYVKKNNQIKNFLGDLRTAHNADYMPADEQEHEKLQKLKQNVLELKTAIENARFDHPIFNDPNCNLLIIYLAQENHENIVLFWQCMTAYLYLLALMQFTSNQILKKEDQNIHFNSDVELKSLLEKNEFSVLGTQFIKETCDRLKPFSPKFKQEAFEAFIKKLPMSEQQLILLKFAESDRNGAKTLMNIVFKNVPFLRSFTENNTIFYYIPSFSIINYILENINIRPVKMKPALGLVNSASVLKLHKDGFHLVTLYAPQVTRNLTKVHEYDCGPIPAILHDIAHTFWGTLLSESQRSIIFNNYIPVLKSILEQVKQAGDSENFKRLETAIQYIADFDLSPIKNYENPVNKLEILLLRFLNFKKEPTSLSSVLERKYTIPLGMYSDDVFYFLLEKANFSHPFDNSQILKKLFPLVAWGREREAHALKKLAWLAAKGPQEPYRLTKIFEQISIDWDFWERLLDSDDSSQTLWDKILKAETQDNSISSQFAEFVLRYHISYFHPYLPLSKEEKARWLGIVKNNLRPMQDLKQPDESKSYKQPAFYKGFDP